MIPLFTLERQNKILEKEVNQAIKEVINRGMFILGPRVAEFEEKFAKYLGVKYAVGVSCGTDALSLALLAVGVYRGDEVILPANSYPTAFAVTAIGAIPKLVDIDPRTFNINPQKVSEAITKKTKAIIPVHLYGQPADMKKIFPIGKKYGIPVVEDCAQAHGAEVTSHVESAEVGLTFLRTSQTRPAERGSNTVGVLKKQASPQTLPYSHHPQLAMKVGSIGDVGCFSFYPTKNLGCFGDGGMAVTNNEEIYKKVKLLRMYGEEKRYNSVLLGRNSRLDELQAAILLVKLKYLDKWNSRRREIADLYVQPRKGSPCKWPYEAPFAKHIYHLFVIRTKKRDQLKKYLEEKGIQTAIHYPKPIHLQPSFKFLGHKKGDFPEAEKACEEVLSLPMFPEMTDSEVEAVVKTIEEKFVNSRSSEN